MTTDLWLDREAAEDDSKSYFDEMALDDELIRLWEEAQDKAKETQKEVDRLLAAGECELIF